MMQPTTQKLACYFIGLVNYYFDMWAKSSIMIQPLTKLKSSKVKFNLGYFEQKAFKYIKRVVAHNTLLAYL